MPGKTDPNFISAVPDGTYANQAVAEGDVGDARRSACRWASPRRAQPNIASTLWRTVSDQKNKVYFFDSATTPNAFWVQMDDLDLSEGAPAKKLPIAGGKYYSGNAAKHFVKETPFKWLQADPTT